MKAVEKEFVLLGLMFSEEMLLNVFSETKTYVHMAPHLFQTKLLDGFRTNGKKIKVYNVPPVGSYPKNYKRLFFKKCIWNGCNIQLGYLNFPFVKHLQQYLQIRKILKDELKKGKPVVVIIYSLYEPYLYATLKLKKRFSNLQIALLQTDAVPGRNDMECHVNKKTIRRGNRLVEVTKGFDYFIILTKHLAEMLEIDGKPTMVMECIADEKQDESKSAMQNRVPICLYTGSTASEYGIREMVDAFSLLEGIAELWICGQGNTDAYIQEAAKQHSNIRHFGLINQREVTKLRDACNFLINPRRPSGTYTKYSFPSKISEYMMSGKPSIMYKLEGIPDEYDQYVNYLSGQTGEIIAKELMQILNMDYLELTQKAQCGRLYMINNKSAKVQSRRIIDFLS